MSHKKRKGLFGLNGIETDALEIGTGVGAALLFDYGYESLMGKRRHNGPNPPVEPVTPADEMMQGIENWTGMRAKPVLMAGTGLLMMRTEYREVGKALAYIGGYTAVCTHPKVREMGGGVYGVTSDDIQGAIESGIQSRLKELQESNESNLADQPVLAGGIENEFDDMFKKSAMM